MALVFLFLLLNILGEFGLAALVNRTIDDYFGDPTTGIFPIYSPQDLWQQGNGCTTCIVQADSSKAFDGTWHDSTFLVGGATRSVSITFTGSAVYAFFITAPIIPGVDSSLIETHLNITLDGKLSGSFDSIPSSSTYNYNQLVYGNSNLPNGQHTLVISSGGPSRSILEFDYVIYTVDDALATSSLVPVVTTIKPSSAASLQTGTAAGTSPSSTATPVHQKSAIGAIVGGAVGGIAIISILIFLVYFCFYRSRDQSTAEESKEKGQAIPSGPQTPGTFTSTPAEIDPFHITPNQSSFYGITAKPGPVHVSYQPPTTSDLRQAELNRRMQELQREMALLQSQSSTSSQYTPSRSEETDGWRSNVELLRAEVERLRVEMHTQSPQGLSDQPPPDYDNSTEGKAISSVGMFSP